MSRRQLKVASLFAGCGGLDLGFVGGFTFRRFNFQANNYKVVFANDFDRDARQVYNQNANQYFGGKQLVFGDVQDLDESCLPAFDVLLAGFPCQPFSNAGLRGGTEDRKGRGTLFYECERILKHAIDKQVEAPKAFVFENVRGILSSKMPDGTPVTVEIERRMQKLGYRVSTQLVNASEYGVPQNRFRVLMIGTRNDLAPFEFSRMYDVVKRFDIPSSRDEIRELTMGAILSDIPKDAPQRQEFWRYSPSGQSMVDMIGPCLGDQKLLASFRRGTSLQRMNPEVMKGRSWKNIPPENLTPRFRKIYDNPKKYHAPNFYRRFALGEICGTITASAQPENCGITHPFENRRLTVREAARVQSFPDDFDFKTATLPGAYKVIGNAVPPILGWTIARSLQETLDLTNNKRQR